jgi:murein DD-endopeptidase MepM/ murein hydrolase activator NlpD
MANRTTKGEAGAHRSSPASSRDWWVDGVAVVAALHVALVLTLRARPGGVAVTLWTWGPPILVSASAALLVAALTGALWKRHAWSWRRLAGLAGLSLVIGSMGVYRVFPSSRDTTPSRVAFRLPLRGPIRVAWGGPTADVNHHVSAPSERWGYDFLVTVDGVSYRGDGTAVTDYHAYDRPVLSPAGGRVVATRDGEPDARPRRPDTFNGPGNFVGLEVAAGEYLFIAHLRAGTVRVRTGERVGRGDVIGHVGNSGNSSEPHVHLHLQSTPQLDEGEGVPFNFSNYIVSGERTVIATGMPRGGVVRRAYVGQIVTSADEFH